MLHPPLRHRSPWAAAIKNINTHAKLPALTTNNKIKLYP
jgi:hypothetical protein